MKKLLAVLLSVMLLASFVSFAVAEEKITLVYQTPSATDMITTAFAVYQETHPNVELDVQVSDNATIESKYMAQADTHTMPDFGWWNGTGWTNIYNQTDTVMNLTDIINNEIGADKFVKDTFFQLTAADGAIVAFPAEMQIQGFLVNKAVFDKLDVAIPTNFAEMLEAAKVFKDNGLVLIGSGTGDTWPTWTWYHWLQRYGIEELQYDLFKDHSLKWADSDCIQAYYRLADLREAGAFSEFNSTITYEQSKTMLLAGQCGILPTSTDQLAGVTGSAQDLNGDIMYWFGPDFEDSKYDQSYSVKLVNNGYGIRSDIEPEKLAVLVDFFKWFYSAEGANTVINSGLVLPITENATVEVTPLTQSIIELTQDSSRTAVMGASMTWWTIWEFNYDCLPALNDFHLDGHEGLINGLVNGSITREQIPEICEKMDAAIDETLAFLAAK